MSLSGTRPLLVLTSVTLALGLPLAAQQGVFQFHHFKRYPTSGQWSTELQGTTNGQPMGPPQTSTTCASPLSHSMKAEVMQLGNNSAPTCKMSIVRDEESTAEVQQVCTFGPSVQTIHTTIKAADDRTLTVEVRSVRGAQETLMKSTSHFLGACPPEQAAAAAALATGATPSALKPDAETCASLPQMRRDTQDVLATCQQMPAADHADCVTRVQGSLRALEQMQQGCRK